MDTLDIVIKRFKAVVSDEIATQFLVSNALENGVSKYGIKLLLKKFSSYHQTSKARLGLY